MNLFRVQSYQQKIAEVIMTIQAVFFDMGGTIDTYRYDSELRIRNASLLRDVLTRCNIILQLNDSQLAAFISKGFSDYKKWSTASLVELPPRQVWSRYIFKDDQILEKLDDLTAEKLSFLYETRFHERKMRPEIPEVLAKLKEMKLIVF